MPSNSGSPEPCPECSRIIGHKMDCTQDRFTADMAREAMAKVREEHYSSLPRKTISLAEGLANFRRASGWEEHFKPTEGLSPALTRDEEQRLADGEPYCFRCGRPASSFSEYGDFIGVVGSIAGNRAAYVRNEEGTWNPATNRFACDGCYTAIGMPATSSGEGWKAP